MSGGIIIKMVTNQWPHNTKDSLKAVMMANMNENHFLQACFMGGQIKVILETEVGFIELPFSVFLRWSTNFFENILIFLYNLLSIHCVCMRVYVLYTFL